MRLRRAIKGTARTWDSAGRASLRATMSPAPRSTGEGLDRLEREITGCRTCPRLVAWREAVAADPPKRFRGAGLLGAAGSGLRRSRARRSSSSASRRRPTAPTGRAGCSPATDPETGSTRRFTGRGWRTSRVGRSRRRARAARRLRDGGGALRPAGQQADDGRARRVPALPRPRARAAGERPGDGRARLVRLGRGAARACAAAGARSRGRSRDSGTAPRRASGSWR